MGMRTQADMGTVCVADREPLERAQGETLQPAQKGAVFCVADTRFGTFASGGVALALDPALRAFAVPGDGCDVRIEVRWADRIARPTREAAFESGGLWSVFDEGATHTFCFSTPALGSAPYKSLRIDRQFQHGELTIRRDCFRTSGPVYPLEYPLDELLMIHRLAQGEGVEVHAMGLVERGRGHLFLGHSGAGKSTFARLWKRDSGALVLSDDRIILRVRDGRIWMYGTPWHGDAGIASPEAAPLCRAYLLEHGIKTELTRVSKGSAAAELLARSFVPHYSAPAMNFTLSFLERVARETPCYVFRFLPDRSAVEAIRDGGG
jgi:hypothetical protein